VSGEQSQVFNSSLAYPTDSNGNILFDSSGNLSPLLLTDGSNKLGWLIGIYAQDEWKITDQLTLNAGVRFDQMYQYVDANQVSPRVSLQYKPWDITTFHIGYARNFTPPEQTIAAPVNLATFNNTTAQPPTPQESPVLPERSHVFDVGVVQKVVPGLEVGVDAYYKLATDLLDDGQFGQALVLSGFNYAKAYNAGLETKVAYQSGNFKAYANLAWARQRATEIVSNQFLFPQDELNYIANNWIYTDHAQLLTGSGGVSYLWQGTRFSADLVYGSGLRNGFANTGTVNVYTPVNLGISHEFQNLEGKPLTVRFDIVNVFDQVYFLRDGSGIGVFAPQYGARRGFYAGVSQKF
jgi:outer membrane receptor protein involved in Fe transport